MKRWIIALVLVALFAVTARAEEPWDGWSSDFTDPADEVMWLSGVTSVYISSYDGVTGGCWTNENATRTAVELLLRGAGISIATDGILAASHIINIKVNGTNTGDARGCYGGVDLEFYQPLSADLIVPGAKRVVLFTPLNTAVHMTGPSMNEAVRTFAIEKTDALALRILRARDAE